ncbi:MAG: ABC transporter ATP-binding protein [Planctomycetota bacterium]|jgi:phospholipid/cholesterol/gamma-HCH transport system ATP-binding protein
MIRLENIHKSFGTQKVLKGYTLHVKKGETFVVLGPSGIGKSVTLKHIVGIMRPDSGRVIVNGEDITHCDRATLYRIRRKVAYLFQSGALINWMTVGENVELPLKEHTNRPYEEIRKRAEETLAHVEMLDSYDKYPDEISGGMRKRAALARVLTQDPEIILYDEPTSGLDPVMTNNVGQVIKDVKEKFNVTSIVVSHDLQSAYNIADRIGIHHDGRIICTGTADEIKNSSDPVVKAFLEGRPVNETKKKIE